jgi:hypothetical protein
MSKLGCICGHVIVDQTDNISYKAKFLRDQDLDSYTNYLDDVGSFLKAIKNGTREKWISEYFSPTYPVDISDSSIIFDIIARHAVEYEGDLYQCENCGRIKVQVQNKNLIASFVPEDNNFKDIFKRFRPNKNVS